MFFCEFCEIYKNNFFYRTLPVAVSESLNSRFHFDTSSNNIRATKKVAMFQKDTLFFYESKETTVKYFHLHFVDAT